MFWKMGLSTSSTIESILDKSAYTLEELLDEERLIQECKAANGRLIKFLQSKANVQQMIDYVITESSEGVDSKRTYKYPFVCCQIFTCEVEGILKTVAEDEEILNLLFSFLDQDRPHGSLLSGYFSKVVITLLIRRTAPLMQYLQNHENLLRRMVDLIGITSIKEVLMRLVGVDDIIYGYYSGSLDWLANSDLLEMLVDKLSPKNSPGVHANAAETLSVITRTAPSALATNLASPRFVSKLFEHALIDPTAKSALVYSLSVCISLLDPKRGLPASSLRSQQTTDVWAAANAETIEEMLRHLGDLLRLLDIQEDTNTLPTTYGGLRPPFGLHRLKIVEFIALLLRTNSETVKQEFLKLQGLQTVVGLFFEYPYNNMLHSHVEAIMHTCIDDDGPLIDCLLVECDFLSRLLATNDNPHAPDTPGKPPHRVGNLGHLTRIANRLVQAGASNSRIQNHLQAHPRWSQWQTTVLQQRNILENVYHWQCGRPTAIRDRPVESDDDDFRERDYDVARMATNLTSDVFRYECSHIGETDGRDEEDVFFDDETAEAVISSIRLSDEQDRLGEDSAPAWFAFQDEASSRGGNGGDATVSSPSSSGSDDDGLEENDLADTAASSAEGCKAGATSGISVDNLSDNAAFNLVYFSKSTDWANFELTEDSKENFGENNPFVNFTSPQGLSLLNDDKAEGDSKTEATTLSEDLPSSPVIVGVESGGTAKAMENALKEGIVGEAGPLKPVAIESKNNDIDEGKQDVEEFNDVNYWRNDYEEAAVVEEKQQSPD